MPAGYQRNTVGPAATSTSSPSRGSPPPAWVESTNTARRPVGSMNTSPVVRRSFFPKASANWLRPVRVTPSRFVTSSTFTALPAPPQAEAGFPSTRMAVSTPSRLVGFTSACACFQASHFATSAPGVSAPPTGPVSSSKVSSVASGLRTVTSVTRRGGCSARWSKVLRQTRCPSSLKPRNSPSVNESGAPVSTRERSRADMERR